LIGESLKDKNKKYLLPMRQESEVSYLPFVSPVLKNNNECQQVKFAPDGHGKIAIRFMHRFNSYLLY
ncbi:hypothetical protein, partial [Pseudomonas amygdali]|uniref:hypothetical protein n=2 Tax=Pseudomonas amygdali TaxID=47877 RepID=UPI001C1254E2